MVVSWNNVLSSEIKNTSLNNFWSGLDVWIQRPHIINRKIVGVEVIETWDIVLQYPLDDTINHVLTVVDSFVDFLDLKERILSVFDTSKVIHVNPVSNGSFSGSFLQFRNLLPKHPSFPSVFEIVLIDKVNGCVVFIPSKEVHASPITPPFAYMLYLSDMSKFDLLVNQPKAESENFSVIWLKTKVVPKIIRWCKCELQSPEPPSLSQVPIKVFSEIYSELKLKYGKKLVESWPESTDPLKFVYEDIGIAAYLMALWSEERKSLNCEQKQSFIDLGCGNGLLVHILSSEGHRGIGIDVRKRNIWNTYGPGTKLLEKAIIPSDSILFPEYDWIIGNHSDELTPWIPVIAARSSFKMRIFLLPCCFYSFNGKFSRVNPNRTRYQSYLDFIEEVCKAMGFNVCKDKLRIPSTKRVCFICLSRNYEYSDEEDIDLCRSAFIHKHSNEDNQNQNANTDTQEKNIKIDGFVPKTDTMAWAQNFKPKEKNETIRNCSALNRTFVESTINLVFNMLLKKTEIKEIRYKESKILWNHGGTYHIKDIANELGSDILQKLKNQCGGLQTLLRSHQNIFSEEKGFISLSIPSTTACISSKRRRRKNVKNSKHEKNRLSKFATKPCFFYFNHPQGCPLANECTFSHEKMDGASNVY